MKITRFISLLGGGWHRHDFAGTGGTGQCRICGETHSPHEWRATRPGVCTVCGWEHDQHEWQELHETGRCRKCTVCFLQQNHVLEGQSQEACGTCSVCGDVITHVWDASTGKCSRCGLEHDHSWRYVNHPAALWKCRACDGCGLEQKHHFPDRTASSCGTCDLCRRTYDSHVWNASTGTCERCRGACPHTEMADLYGGTCGVCGKNLSLDNYSYNVSPYSSAYGGRYVYEGDISGQKYYRRYFWRGTPWGWYAQDMRMVVLNMPSPSQFGDGVYYYTGSGYVFTSAPRSLQINNTLLQGDGKYHVSLQQYRTADTSSIISSGGYTSPDCSGIVINA